MATTRDMAGTIFDLIEPFAGYAFNKAHSISYALISYWTAYFKAHYPLEYMGAVLNSRMDHPEKMVSSINECFQLGIPVLLPDINKSGEHFTIDESEGTDPGLRVGLAAIKTVGESAVRPLIEERDENGPYKSIDDFCRRGQLGRPEPTHQWKAWLKPAPSTRWRPEERSSGHWTRFSPLPNWRPATAVQVNRASFPMPTPTLAAVRFRASI